MREKKVVIAWASRSSWSSTATGGPTRGLGRAKKFALDAGAGSRC